MQLIQFTDRGLYCPIGDFYIDPWRPVNKALITHGHSDHSRWGHKKYIATTSSLPIIKHRLGDIDIIGIDYGTRLLINGVKVSFHPAGHILGSAQIRVEHKGEIWVVSGDYKPGPDNVSEPFDLVRCHHFITESTFGLPSFNWVSQEEVFASIRQWWAANQAQGKSSILCAYALGKAQRIIQGLGTDLPGPIYTHGAVEQMNTVIRSMGVPLLQTTPISQSITKEMLAKGLTIATPAAIGTSWIKKFKDPVVSIASGWMALRGARRRRAADKGFILSDHADWRGLNEVIQATGAEHIYVTHGYTDIFCQWLREQGYDAHVVSTEYGAETEELLDEKEQMQDAS
jgi:putative mRNA 3-end processing factor